MGISKDLGIGPAFLDTSVFIYFIEENKHYIEVVNSIFDAIDKGSLRAVTSGITLLETLVIPLKANDLKLANQYEQLLMDSHGLTTHELNRNILRQGAYLRAKHQIKTPDALQLATAMQSNCRVFVTNDRRLPKISSLQILQLSNYLCGQ